MSETPQCPNCGGTMPAASPGGHCPSCLLRIGLALADGGIAAGLDPAASADAPVSSPDLPPPTRIRYVGDYELMEEIGRGGMGIVYRARQISLNRSVALKLVRAGDLADEKEIARFRTEAEAAANLDHPNIVPIYEVGEHEGRHYFSMKLIEGGALSERISNHQSQISNREAAKLLATISRAVHYAHQRGLLHRDLKPGNILLDAQGQPHVTDFGLAKRIEGDSSMTMSGAILGTASYMAPEQAAGAKQLTTAADIYSLGAILYELLTGRPPFRGTTVMETLLQVQQNQPKPPSTLVPRLDSDLQVICLKCLEKEPQRRYGSAEALADDLERWLAGKPIHARPTGVGTRLVKWVYREPALGAAVSAALVIALAGLVGIVWQWQRARVESANARLNAYVADMNLAHQAYSESGNLGRAVELLRRHRDSGIRGWEWRYLWRLFQSHERATIGAFSNTVSAVEFAPDGSIVATGGHDGTVRFWDPQTWRETQRWSVDRVRSVAFSPDASLLAVGTLDHQVSVWNWRLKQRLASFPCTQWSHGGALAFSPDGRSLVVAGKSGAAEVRSVPDFMLKGQLQGQKDGSSALAFSPDGKWIAADAGGGRIGIWETATWQRVRIFAEHAHEYFINSLEFSPDGKTLLSSGWDAEVKLWDAGMGQRIGSFQGHKGAVHQVRFSPDGALAASASLDQTIRIWETASYREIARLQGHEDEVGSLVFSPDGKQLVSGGKDGAVRTWDVTRPTDDDTFLALEAGMIGGEVAADGSILAARYFPHIDVWDPIQRRKLGRIAHSRRMGSVSFAANGGVLACGFTNGTVLFMGAGLSNVFQALPGLAATDPGASPQLGSMALSRNGKLLMTADSTGRARIFEWAAGRELANWPMPTGDCILAFAPDNQLAARGGEDGMVQVWRVADGTCLATLPAHQGTVGSVCFSPDGRRLATGGWDGVIKLWEIESSRLVTTLRGYRSGVFRVAFSPDGSRLATATAMIKVWDLQTQQEVLTLKGHSINKVLMGLTPDGNTLISGSADGIRYWHAPSFEEINAAEAKRP